MVLIWPIFIWLASALATTGAAAGTAAGAVGGALGSAAGAVGGALGSGAGAIGSGISTALSSALPALQGAGSAIGKGVGQVGSALGKVGTGIKSGLTSLAKFGKFGSGPGTGVGGAGGAGGGGGGPLAQLSKYGKFAALGGGGGGGGGGIAIPGAGTPRQPAFAAPGSQFGTRNKGLGPALLEAGAGGKPTPQLPKKLLGAAQSVGVGGAPTPGNAKKTLGIGRTMDPNAGSSVTYESVPGPGGQGLRAVTTPSARSIDRPAPVSSGGGASPVGGGAGAGGGPGPLAGGAGPAAPPERGLGSKILDLYLGPGSKDLTGGERAMAVIRSLAQGGKSFITSKYGQFGPSALESGQTYGQQAVGASNQRRFNAYVDEQLKDPNITPERRDELTYSRLSGDRPRRARAQAAPGFRDFRTGDDEVATFATQGGRRGSEVPGTRAVRFKPGTRRGDKPLTRTQRESGVETEAARDRFRGLGTPAERSSAFSSVIGDKKFQGRLSDMVPGESPDSYRAWLAERDQLMAPEARQSGGGAAPDESGGGGIISEGVGRLKGAFGFGSTAEAGGGDGQPVQPTPIPAPEPEGIPEGAPAEATAADPRAIYPDAVQDPDGTWWIPPGTPGNPSKKWRKLGVVKQAVGGL